MYEIFISLLLIVSQIQNVSMIYAVEIQLIKQKMQEYTKNVVKRATNFYNSYYEYFYPAEKIIKKEVKVVLYENKYKEKFHEMNGERDVNKNNILIEETPIGNVIMFYNSEKNIFEYYSDKTIPFRFLETVARKYVVTFHCKHIYVEQTKGKNKKTNVFLYLGKIANYSFLKKVEKHVTNKKMNMSFREFKNMNL